MPPRSSASPGKRSSPTSPRSTPTAPPPATAATELPPSAISPQISSLHGRSKPLGSPCARRSCAGGGAQPRRVQRHLPLHEGRHGRADGLQVHLQPHARGRGGRVPEVEIMRHMAPHPNIVTLNGTHDDKGAVPRHGALQGRRAFHRIALQGHYTERVAAALTRTIVEELQVRRLLVFSSLLLTALKVHLYTFYYWLLYAVYWFNYKKNC